MTTTRTWCAISFVTLFAFSYITAPVLAEKRNLPSQPDSVLDIIADEEQRIANNTNRTSEQASPANNHNLRPQLSLLHDPENLVQMPEPGQFFDLTVALLGNEESPKLLRVHVVRDGRSFQIHVPEFSTNEIGQSIYRATLAAPIADISYHFSVESKAGKVQARSPWYYARRGCIPKITTSEQVAQNASTVEEKSRALGILASQYEHQVASYDAVVTRLRELADLVGH